LAIASVLNQADENADAPTPEAESREPTVTDLVQLCAWLNRHGAKYVVIGGFARRAAGYLRTTMDVHLLVEVSSGGLESHQTWIPQDSGRSFHCLQL
jgi:hypothetical protein